MQQYDELKKKFIDELAKQGISDMDTLADEVLKQFDKTKDDVGIGVIFTDPGGQLSLDTGGWRTRP
jgi:hypothetical protein